jgi:hypothetical protein
MNRQGMDQRVKGSIFRRGITAFLLLALVAEPFQHKKPAAPAEQDALLKGSPFSLDQIVRLVDVHPDRLKSAITRRGVAFEATPQNLDELKKAGISSELIDLIQRIAPKHTATVEAVPQTGNLIVRCAPADCRITIDGRPHGSTKGGALEIQGLPVKKVVVDFEKDGFIGQQKGVQISAGKSVSSVVELEPSTATKAQWGTVVLTKATDAFGGDAGFRDTTSLFASGAAVVFNKDGQRTDWTLAALLKLPDLARLEFEGSTISFWVSLAGDKYKFGGKNKKLADASDFDSGVRLFRDLQVSAIVNRIRKGDFQLSADSQNEDSAGEFRFRATNAPDGFEVTLGRDGLPERIKYESQAGLGTGTEILYSNYAPLGKGKYPLTMIVKLPDAAHHGFELRFEKAIMVPDLKEKDFNAGHYKPPK